MLRKRLLFPLIFLVLVLALAGCSAVRLAPEDTVRYSRALVSDELCAAIRAGDSSITLHFSRSDAPDFSVVQSDINHIHQTEFLPARFTSQISWEYDLGLFYSTLDLDIDYTGDTQVIAALESGENPGLVPVQFTKSHFSDWLSRLVYGRQTVGVCLYSGDEASIADAVQDVTAKLDGDWLFPYCVSEYECSSIVAAGYTELRMELAYRDDAEDPSTLLTADTALEAVDIMMDCWSSGERTAAFLISDSSWDTDRLFELAEAADANCSLSCEYIDAGVVLYPESGKLRAVEVRLTYPIQDSQFLLRNEALNASEDSVYAELFALGLEDEREQYLAIHDRVLELSRYSDSLATATIKESLTADMYSSRTAYGVFVSGGETVCTGYARAFKALCDRFSLPCWVMYGRCDGIGHAWNAVPLNERVYYVDCTFNDSGENQEYFLIPLDIARQRGYIVDEGYTLPDWME